MDISLILPVVLSAAALVLPGILKSDGWPDWANALVAGAVVALFAGLTVWSGGRWTSNVYADWALFATAYSALLAGPLKGLDEALTRGVNLPFLGGGSVPRPPAPTPIVLPQGSSLVPPRASAMDVPPQPPKG